MTDRKDYQLGFYAHQVSGTDVCHDRGLKWPLTALFEMEKGFVVYAMGPAGEAREITVTSVCGRNWGGESGGMIVSGSFQPDRYPKGSVTEGGGWAAEMFGDASRIAMAEF